MKRVITTLAILLVVVVVGLTALVLLVKPNTFKSYMVKQVEERSGYRLTLSDDLRWHVWPKLSILSGQMTLTAPGAQAPAVTAENMRLDVQLLPLLSHRLRVSQVVLKNAVVRDLPETQGHYVDNAPKQPEDEGVNGSGSRGWSLDIAQLTLADSLLVLQDPRGNPVNFREVNLELNQRQPRQGTFSFSSNISRNQQTLQLALQGTLDATHYPEALTLRVDEGSYGLKGVALPKQGIQGALSLVLDWQPLQRAFQISQLVAQANESDFQGRLSGKLGSHSELNLSVKSKLADFDQLTTTTRPTAQEQNEPQTAFVASPVISSSLPAVGLDRWLDAHQLTTEFHADTLRWQGLNLTQVNLEALTRDSVIKLKRLTGQAAQGDFSITGQVDFRDHEPRVAIAPQLNKVPLALVQKVLGLPAATEGLLSLHGDFRGKGLQGSQILTQWQGKAQADVTQLKITAFDLPQMVSNAVNRASNKVQPALPQTPIAPDLSGIIDLNQGVLTLHGLKGSNSQLNMDCRGAINFLDRSLDISFDLLMSGWQGDSRLVQLLSNQPIPVRFYGPWQKLQYSLPVEPILRGEIRQRLNDWLKSR